MIEMIPGTVTLSTLEQIWRNGTPARLAASARAGVLCNYRAQPALSAPVCGAPLSCCFENSKLINVYILCRVSRFL